MMASPQQQADVTSHDKPEATTVAVTAEEDGGVEVVGVSGEKKKIIEDVPPPSFDVSVLPTGRTYNNVECNIKIKPSRKNSPRSQLEFDIKATSGDDDEERSQQNHSHVAFEIQHKTQAMRDLDGLLADDDVDDEPVRVTFDLDEEEESKKTIKRSNKRKEQKKSPRHSEWLFSCSMDEIDEVVEDIISPFDDITNFMSCATDDSIVMDRIESVCAEGETL
mmetsp:Transcript_20494/g.30764  ORF Transcript_20494/g.30764 Transcript_20494/m.30764 type:complete len:221 (-) Transcript_20494:206-868(-)